MTSRPVALRARVVSIGLQALLIALGLVVLVTQVVRNLVRPGGLVNGLVDGSGPYWGLAPSVDAQYVASTVYANATGLNLPPGLGGGPYGPGEAVEFTLPTLTTVTVWDPTFRQQLALTIVPALVGVAALWVLWIAIRIVRTLRQGTVFSARNVVRLYSIAAILGVGGVLLQALWFWGYNGILDSPAASGWAMAHATVNLVPLWSALIVAGAAEVFRQGLRLHSETVGLV
ncbi:MAG: DUF2975 domain-containing protein [Motilibacteraceae bacterium]